MKLKILPQKNIYILFIAFFYSGYCVAQPIISSFSPASGLAGSSVTISGSNFSAAAANNIVFFGAVKANVSAASASSLTVTVPFGATYQPITVTTGGLTGYSSKPFVQIFAAGVAIANGSFAPKIDSTTDLHPNGLAVADYDADGKPDIATANNYSTAGSPASVSVLRNTGTPTAISFAPRIDLITGVLTYAIATADLNGDGKPDLVSSSIVDKTISVFKNTSTVGNISFAAKIDYTTGDNPYSISIHDIDADGKPDIVVANYLSQTVSVYKNTGSGGNIAFAAKVDFSTALGPRCVAIADLDGDGKPDLAVSNQLSNTISAFRNTSTPGNISFAAKVDFTTGNTPYSVAVGDLNNDGKPELAVSNNAANTFSIFRNTSSSGTISFAAKVDFNSGPGPYLISIGDVNGDAKPDIVLPGINLSVSQNLSSGSTISFAAPTYQGLPSAFAAAIVDLDADGKDDIAGAIFTGDKVSLSRNRNNEPIINNFVPSVAGTGTTVTLIGENFNGSTSVNFGGVPAASFTVVSNTSISAVVGTGMSGEISVTNAYGTGKISGFTFAGPPIISSFTPSTTGEGQTVTITGNNLSGATAVSFGGIAANSFTIVSPNIITAVVSTGASGNVSVTTPYGTGILGGFIFVPFPNILSFTPASGMLGTSVSITGNNFNGATAVNFGGTPAMSFTVNSNTSITAIVGNGSSGNVSVTTNFGTATRSGFTFIPPPVISSFTPTSGQTGNVITISGTNFTGVTAVHFGGMPANSFTVISPTTITAIISSGATGSIRITGPGGIDSIAGFTFIPPVRINSITPDYGPAAANIIITGTGFQTTPSANKVTVGSIAATVIAASPTSLTVLAPAVATNKPVNVLINNLIAFSPMPYRTSFVAPDTAFSANSFSPPSKFTGGGSVCPLISVDIDGDGKLEMINTNAGSKKIVIFRNTSSGNSISFAPRIEINDYWVPYGVVSADLDGDGKPDLVSGSVGVTSVYRNTSTVGSITFAPRIEIPIGNAADVNRVTLSDVDGDGRIDLIVRPTAPNSTNSIIVLRNKSTVGTLAFEDPKSFFIGINGSSIHDLLAEDLDGDGKPEIIVNTPVLSCLRNTSIPGIISFSPLINNIDPNATPYVSQYISIADVDGDGKKDIAVYVNTAVTVYKNQSVPGNISFTSNPFPTATTSNIRNVTLGDLNGDGKPEIVCLGGAVQNKFFIFNNKSTTGTVSYGSRTDYFYSSIWGYEFTDIADIDGDNQMDVILSFGSSDSIFIFKNLMGNPVNQLCANSNTSLTSNISGTTYQWQENTGSGFNNISNNAFFSGVTTATLQISNVPIGWNGYQYRCNVNSSAFSIVTTLNVTAAPIATAGTDTTICAGSSVQLNGSGGTTYSWTPAAGLSNPNIANPIATPSVTTAYVLTVFNSGNCTAKDTVVVSIVPLVTPSISISTPATTICSGSIVTFNAITNNGGALPAYQWQVNGINSGTNSSTFTTTSLQNGDLVKCMLTSNAVCVTGTTATSNVIAITINASAPASVVINTTSTVICVGTITTFTAVPSNGGSTPAYQWQINGVTAGTNSNTFTSSALNNNDQVKVILTSSLVCAMPANATSNVIGITVVPMPVANAGIDVTICTGGSVQLLGSGGATYSWSPAAGLSNPNIANPVASPAATTAYTLTVSNGGSCTSNDVVVVTVGQGFTPTVNINTANTNICEGSTVSFTSAITNGGSNPVYQWQVDGVNAGSNNPIFTTSTLNNNSQVKLILASNLPCVTTPTATSNIITLNVTQLATPVIILSNSVFTVTNPDAVALYTWQVKNNNVWADVIPSATGISYTASATGEYRVKAVKGPCTKYSASQTTNFTGGFSHFIALRPNPAHQYITLDSIALSKKYETVEIIDMHGKMVLPLFNVINRNSITIDISMLSNGVFMAIIRQKDGTYSAKRFIKQ